MATPLTIIALEVVDSTQDEARQRYSGTPLVVIAGAQRRGRGRTGATWESAPRALAVSLAWSPHWPVSAVARLTLVAGLAALDVIGGDGGLKWPNDVMIGGAKAGGILTERYGDTVITGLGLNLYWPDPPPGFGALTTADPGADAARHLGERWAERLLQRAASGPDGWGRAEYLARCVTIGEEIAWDPDGRGTATGIASDGGLVVMTSAGEVVLESGAVRTVRRRGGPGGRG
ncbi:MAG: biotin--[acetyl-CoA-carboxylase] ligase [Acidimicrobiia bacterium]|nr:biotin--[acetyl-CoA-carboxylase] ligase [Acidimicrobiia bacterium]